MASKGAAIAPLATKGNNAMLTVSTFPKNGQFIGLVRDQFDNVVNSTSPHADWRAAYAAARALRDRMLAMRMAELIAYRAF